SRAQACWVKAFYCDDFVLPLPVAHRFPMRRYALLRERVAALSGIQLLVPQAVSPERLLRVHDPDYVSRVFGGGLTALEQRRLGFPWSPALLERSLRSVGAT